MNYLERKRSYVRIYRFTELLSMWKQGKITIDEVIEPIMQALRAFKERALRLDYKLMLLTSPDDIDGFDEYIDMDTLELIKTMPLNTPQAYQMVDRVIEQFAMMEIRLLQMERDYEEIFCQLDYSYSHLN